MGLIEDNIFTSKQHKIKPNVRAWQLKIWQGNTDWLLQQQLSPHAAPLVQTFDVLQSPTSWACVLNKGAV